MPRSASAVKRTGGADHLQSIGAKRTSRWRAAAGGLDSRVRKGTDWPGLQGLRIGRESPVIEFVIAGVAQGDAHGLRHRQFAGAVIDDRAGDRQHHLAVFAFAVIIDMGEIDATACSPSCPGWNRRPPIAARSPRSPGGSAPPTSRSAAPPRSAPTQPSATAQHGQPGGAASARQAGATRAAARRRGLRRIDPDAASRLQASGSGAMPASSGSGAAPAGPG